MGSTALSATLPLVEAERLEVTFGRSTQAIASLDLVVGTGEFVAIVGPSGCGKSTFLRTVAGLLAPSAGHLTVGGLPPAVARQQATRISFVFQDATLLPWRSVWDNVALPLELARSPATERPTRIQTAIDLVELGQFAHHFPGQLSGGMRMRVSLARALVNQPDLLLLDEPFGALDEMTRQKLNEELLALWSERRWTALFVTHNISEAVFLSQRVLVMAPRPSRIVADVPVPWPMPRSTDLRSQADFARLTGEIAGYLRGASA